MPFNPMSFLQDSLMTKYFCSTFFKNVFQDKPYGHLIQHKTCMTLTFSLLWMTFIGVNSVRYLQMFAQSINDCMTQNQCHDDMCNVKHGSEF